MLDERRRSGLPRHTMAVVMSLWSLKEACGMYGRRMSQTWMELLDSNRFVETVWNTETKQYVNESR